MIYSVLWHPVALDELTALWLAGDAPSRQLLTLRTHEIDQLLGTDPFASGESRGDDLRVLLLPPFGVNFEVLAADRKVHVLHIWLFRQGPRNP